MQNCRRRCAQRRRASPVRRPIGIGELAVGGIAVALENAPPARKMPFDASGGAAVFEAVGHDRRPCSATETIVSQISPQIASSRSPASGRQDRQGGLVGENPGTVPDELEKPIGERPEVEADMAHPARHEITSLRLEDLFDPLEMSRQRTPPAGLLGGGRSFSSLASTAASPV